MKNNFRPLKKALTALHDVMKKERQTLQVTWEDQPPTGAKRPWGVCYFVLKSINSGDRQNEYLDQRCKNTQQL